MPSYPDHQDYTVSPGPSEELVRQAGLREGLDWRSILLGRLIDGKNQPKHLLRDRKFASVWTTYTEARDTDNKAESEVLQHLRAASRIAQDRRRRLELQARVLARQDVPTIADLMDLLPEVVATYEDFYFDVRPNIEARNWIATEVLDELKFAGDAAERQLLVTAYFGGPVALEFSLQSLPFHGCEHDLSTPTGQMREQAELLLLSIQLLQEPGQQAMRFAAQPTPTPPNLPLLSRGPSELLNAHVMRQLREAIKASARDSEQDKVQPAPLAV